MTRYVKLQDRAFLEPENLKVDSFINWSVCVEGDGHSYADVKIADCHRNIKLEFDVDDKGEGKLDALIDHLINFRRAFRKGRRAREHNKSKP